jgi:phosphatidylglycerol:prolipoprotein diacylglycerol transferase
MLHFLATNHNFDPLNPIFIQIGDSLSWHMYSLMIMTGLAIAIILGIREGAKLGISSNDIIDGVIIVVPLSIIGTRLWYVAFEWDLYKNDLFGIFDLTKGGLAIHGGFITAFISVYFYTKFKKINFLSAFDITAPGFLIAQAFGRWGNFFNQEAHGGVIGGAPKWDSSTTTETMNAAWDTQREFLSGRLHLPDFITNQMYLKGPDGLHYYHPTFLYESMWNIVGFIIMLVLRRTKLLKRGELLPVYLIWYSIGRFFIEGMRTDSLYIGDSNFRTAQVISVLMIIAGVALFAVSRFVFKTKFYHEVLTEVAEANAVSSDKIVKDNEEETPQK